ncbi:hypothetical protein [Mesorhizobium huakuii]|uniref:hypothetical protein n=1 Tax=Mesorhizobium huakuii TaxID=28104 RepID=UPI001614AD52|nr:hypothetical protein [Mesorhizobium huakuii]
MTTICVVFVRHGTRIKLISILPAYRQTVDKRSMHQRYPKTVEPGLLDDDDRKASSGSCLCLPFEFSKSIQQSGDIAGGRRMFRHLLAAARRQRGDQPFRAAEFE